MLVLLEILCFFSSSSALAVPSTKSYLEIIYSLLHKVAGKEFLQTSDIHVKKLKENPSNYWIMAHTSNPWLVVEHLATSTTSGAFCLLSTMTLAKALFRSLLIPRSVEFCVNPSISCPLF